MSQEEKIKNSQVRHTDIKLGVYKHYKGNSYHVLGTASDPITNETLVVYETISGHPDVVYGLKRNSLFLFPLSLFFDNVRIPDDTLYGALVPRFKYLGSYRGVYGYYKQAEYY